MIKIEHDWSEVLEARLIWFPFSNRNEFVNRIAKQTGNDRLQGIANERRDVQAATELESNECLEKCDTYRSATKNNVIN